MKQLVLISFALLAMTAKGQFCTNDNRFTEVDYFQDNELDTISDIEYAQAFDYQGNLNILLLDIYMPKPSADPLEKRPFVLQMFGGGFVTGDKLMMRGDCLGLARKGFVTASINYRLGDVNEGRAIYRAQQDAHAALRWIVENADTYGIDTNWIFVGGQSAGAIAAGYLHYASQDDWNAAVPWMVDSLGTIESSGNNFNHSFSIKGLIMNWGAVRMADVSPSEMIPMIGFHGEDDPIVPLDTTVLGSGGSRWLHNELVANSTCSDLTVAPGAGHSPPVLFPPFVRMPKISCFFKSLFCANCSPVYAEEVVEANCSAFTGTEELTQSRAFHVFPNPLADRLTIEGAKTVERIQLIDVSGSEIYNGNYTNQMDVSHLNAGVYFLRVFSGDAVEVHKLIKN